LIFAVHPIHSEVVLSMKNREEIVCAILSLVALLQAVQFYETKKIWKMIVSVICLTAAFLAKESAVVFLIIIPLAIVFFRTNFKLNLHFNPKQKESYFVLGLWLLVLIFLFSTRNLTLFNAWTNNILFITGTEIGKHIIWFFGLLYIILILLSVKINSFRGFRPEIKNPVLIIAIVCLVLSYASKSNIFELIFMIIISTIVTRKILVKQQNLTADDSKNVEINCNLLKNKPTLYTIGLLVLSLVIISSIYYAQETSLPEKNAPVFKWQNPIFDLTKTNSEKLAVAFYSLAYYAKLVVIPYPLRFYYGYKMIPDTSLTNIVVIISILSFIALLVLAFLMFDKRSPISFGILFFIVAILPFSNFVFPLTGIIAERLLFVPSIGFSIIVAFLIIKLTKTEKTEFDQKKIFYKPLIICSLIIIPFTLVSISRNDDWKDRPTLYKHDIMFLENSAKANNLYANYLMAEVYGRMQMSADVSPVKENINLAIKHYQRAIEIDSTYSNPYHNLGYIYLIVAENNMLAKNCFDKCIALDSTIDEAVLNRGIANFGLNLIDNAIADLNKYMKISGKMPDKAYYYLAKAYIVKTEYSIAGEYFLKLLETNKTTRKINDEIKNYFVERKEFKNAVLAAQNQVRFDPNSDKPYVDMGNFYLLAGDTLKAIENWETAFEKYNGNFNIAMTLSGYYSGKGNQEKAQYYYQKAVAFRQKQK